MKNLGKEVSYGLNGMRIKSKTVAYCRSPSYKIQRMTNDANNEVVYRAIAGCGIACDYSTFLRAHMAANMYLVTTSKKEPEKILKILDKDLW